MRQYQLAIVEDEPHTARYIQGIVEATNLFHIAAVCESAEELLTLEPFPDLDVLVTDVKMSGLTGLELLRELQTRLPQLCSIIIGGYDSFEYARDAIRLNVSNYILKPISKDELTVALLHLYDQLSNLRQKSGEEYLNSLYQEGEQPLEQALSLPAPYYHVLMAAGMNDQNQLILRCRTLLALEKHPELQMCIYQYGFLILLGVGQADAPNRLEQSAATIAAWERDSGATALLLLTDRAVAREELKREARHLFHAHQKNLVLGKSVVMRLSAARTPEANTKEEQALTERLQQSLTAQNAEHFHMALCQLFSSWESRSADIYTIKQLLFALVSRVSQKRENSDDPITLMNTLMDTLYRATGYEAACSAVWAVLEPELFPVSGLENESPKQSQRMFHKIVQFLNHHIDQNYSLQEISDTFGISQPYVSKLFRANAGTSYKDYVTKQKIQTAIEIMTSNPAVLIKDIAEQLGYDQLYFSTVFHRITGEYPKHYRERLEQRAKDGQA